MSTNNNNIKVERISELTKLQQLYQTNPIEIQAMSMDEKLIKAIKEMADGKESGFNVVYSETYNHVYFRAKQHMHDEEDALDLTQIVFVEAFKNIGSLQTPEALYGWLDSGRIFGKTGRGFQRINVACPRSVLNEALTRINKCLEEV